MENSSKSLSLKLFSPTPRKVLLTFMVFIAVLLIFSTWLDFPFENIRPLRNSLLPLFYFIFLLVLTGFAIFFINKNQVRLKLTHKAVIFICSLVFACILNNISILYGSHYLGPSTTGKGLCEDGRVDLCVESIPQFGFPFPILKEIGPGGGPTVFYEFSFIASALNIAFYSTIIYTLLFFHSKKVNKKLLTHV